MKKSIDKDEDNDIPLKIDSNVNFCNDCDGNICNNLIRIMIKIK